MKDYDTYMITRNNMENPIYVEESCRRSFQVGPFYDEEGNETTGSKIGGYLSLFLMIGFIFYLWAR
ncbi:hypothetical protein ACW0S9_08825 [Fusobacterium polymorphum]|jgi:hypothetical protein